MHKKARKQFAEDKKTKDMDYWNHVLWSDETKINLFGSDGVKRVAARAALIIGLGHRSLTGGPRSGSGPKSRPTRTRAYSQKYKVMM